MSSSAGPAPGCPDSGHVDLGQGDAYGRSFADVYDHWYEQVTDADATADYVARHHPGGPVVELGVGTGRLAAPMATRGLTVVGVDASTLMLARCPRGPTVARGETGNETKDGAVIAVLADLRHLPFCSGAKVGTALIAFNTFFNLTSAADQVALLTQVAELLRPDGVLLVEALDVTPLLDGPVSTVGLRERHDRRVVVTATQADPTTQQVDGHHIEVDDVGARVRPWRLRWATPDQIDLMASHAGLILDRRMGSWEEAPFDGPGTTHISVYRKGEPGARC